MWQMAEPRALSTHQTLRLGAVLAAFWLGACAHTPPVREADVPKTPAGYLVGYLPASEVPDSRALLDQPPAAGSPQQLVDLAEARAMLDLRDTARWAAARRDADLSYPVLAPGPWTRWDVRPDHRGARPGKEERSARRTAG